MSRYQRNHPSTKRTLSAEEFLVLLNNTFKFLNFGRIRKSILLLIFGLIDKNKDGVITLSEYLDWVKRFLAVDLNRGDEFYVKDDDESIEGGDIFEAETPLVILPDPQDKKLVSVSHKIIRFNFSNYDLSKQVRQRVHDLLVPFDTNKDLKFDEDEIKRALVELLKENETELKYVTRNVFRYDLDGDKNVTYD